METEYKGIKTNAKLVLGESEWSAFTEFKMPDGKVHYITLNLETTDAEDRMNRLKRMIDYVGEQLITETFDFNFALDSGRLFVTYTEMKSAFVKEYTRQYIEENI